MSEKIENYRKDIAEIDSKILRLFKARLQTAKKIGDEKKRHNLPVTSLKVEAEVINRSQKLAGELGLEESSVSKLMELLISEAVNVQEIPTNRARFLYDIFEKVQVLEANGEKIFKLDVGEPDLPSPIELKDALKDALYKKRFVGYSSAKGLNELKECIADHLNETYGVDITREQVLVTTGGKFAIFSAIVSMISSGDHVVIPEPSWPVYKSCVQLANGRVDVVHTCLEESWNIDLTDIEEAFSIRPKLLILCSPNNPTGKVFSETQLRELAKLAKGKGTYILADEVYDAYATTPFKSILQVMDSNFIYVNTFSKRYGMTGWRIGYAVSDVQTIAKMQSLVQISVTCVPEFIQYAALKALTMRQDPYKAFVKEIRKRIHVACQELDRLALSYFRPEGGMYVFPKTNLNGFNSYIFANKLLELEKVAVVPGEAFGNYPEHFRISLGTSVVDIRRAIRKIGKVINNWHEE